MNFKKLMFLTLLLTSQVVHAQVSPSDDDAEDQPADLQVVEIKPKSLDSLHLRVIMEFPANVKTIQQATHYLLETGNYKLILNPADPDGTRQILSRPLLPQDSDGSLKAIEDALLQIAGDDTVLIIDRENKLISFEFNKPKKRR